MTADKECTFGAVVSTLKATGWGLLFVIVNERLTRILNGPSPRILVEDYKEINTRNTLKP
jgi:hypothetical protein